MMTDAINQYLTVHHGTFRAAIILAMIGPVLLLAIAYNIYNAFCSFVDKQKGQRHD
jgi:hypothetical protein